MIKISILYPNSGHFDLDYYLNEHMPMSIERLKSTLRGVSVEQGISGGLPGTEPAYIAACHFSFDSLDDFMSAFMPHAEELQGDIKNYTDVEPIIQISEVKISQ